MNWGINPFLLLKSVEIIDLDKFSFLQTQPHKQIQSYLNYSYRQEISSILIIGERGSGKTTTLIWLKRQIEAQKELDPKHNYRFVLYNNLRQLNLHDTIKDLGYSSAQDLYAASHKEENKLYVLIDVADKMSARDYMHFVEYLEDLMHTAPPLVMIVSMNSETKKLIDSKFSLILGKFLNVGLKPFSLDETREFLASRLEAVNIQDRFSEEAVETTQEISRGIPRSIISVALRLSEPQHDINTMTRKQALEILEVQDFIEELIEVNIENPTLRESAIYLYRIILANQSYENQTDLMKDVKLNKKTIIRCLDILSDLGIIQIERAGRTHVAKKIQVRKW